MTTNQKLLALAALALSLWYFFFRKPKSVQQKDIPGNILKSQKSFLPAKNPSAVGKDDCDPKYFVMINGVCTWRFALPGTTANPVPPMPI